MFLAAVMRPRYNDDGVCTFDGKIGMLPFIERVAAHRTSALRACGTIITRTVPAVNKVRYLGFLVNKALPAIRAKWPGRDQFILIQQDGASAHIDDDDAEFIAAGQHGLWNMKMETQPAKSHDFNVLDLSFSEHFRVINGEVDLQDI